MPPRTFTPADYHTITTEDFNAMSVEDQRAYSQFILDQWARTDEAALDGDYAKVGSKQSTDWGE